MAVGKSGYAVGKQPGLPSDRDESDVQKTHQDRVARVGMKDAFHVRSTPIDSRVNRSFRRDRPFAGDPFAAQVYQADVLRFGEDTRRPRRD